MIVVKDSARNKSGVFIPGQALPLDRGTKLFNDGITLCPPDDTNEVLISRSMDEVVRVPQITYGVAFCNLNCPYCLNEYENSTGEFALSQYGSKIEALTRLCEWVGASTEYTLGWAVGEPLSKTGLEFIGRFQYALTDRARAACVNIGIHTNGTYMEKNPFPEGIYANFKRRSVFWTVALLSENDVSHRSIERHFDFLMACARNFRARNWMRGVRLILPSNIPLSELPQELIDKSYEFLAECKPNAVEPFYLVRLTQAESDATHHEFYPNIRDYLWKMYDVGVLDKLELDLDYHARLIERPTVSVYDKIIQSDKPTRFLLSDLNHEVDAMDLPKVSYRDYASPSLKQLMRGEVNPMCVHCNGLPYCTVFQRADLHTKFGWDLASHTQYEDTLLNMMYLYALLYLSRSGTYTFDKYYTGQPISGERVKLRFPVNVAEFAAAESADLDSFGVVRKHGEVIGMAVHYAKIPTPGYEPVELRAEGPDFVLTLEKLPTPALAE